MFLVNGKVEEREVDLIPDRIRSEHITDINGILHGINSEFCFHTGSKLWKGNKLYEYMAGSSRYFFDENISADYRDSVIKTVGDVDIRVSKEVEKELKSWFSVSTESTFPGDAKLVATKNGGNYAWCFFESKKCGLFQIDFEFVPFEKSRPDKFSDFYISSLDDLEIGIKGMCKFVLLSCLSEAPTRSVVLWDGGISRVVLNVNDLVFSPGNGVRNRYAVIDSVYTVPVVRELKRSEFFHTRDVNTMFQMYFRANPKGRELNRMFSFVGLSKLAGEYLTEKECEIVLYKMIEKFFLQQKPIPVDREDRLSDEKIKMKCIDTFSKLSNVSVMYANQVKKLIPLF